MKPVIALYMAQAKESLRDRSVLLFVILLPVVFGVFFGLVFSGNGGGFILQLGVADQDAGPAGAEFVESLQASEIGQSLKLHLGSREELLGKLEKAEVHVVLVLPADLTSLLAARQPAEIETVFDPTRQTSSMGLGIVNTILNNANLQLSGAQRLLTMRERPVQTEPIRQIDFYMAGMLGVALLWLGVFGVAQPLVSQREQQILRRFSVTAITHKTMLLAEVSWRVSIGLIQAAIFVAVGYVGFGVTVENWLTFMVAVLLGALVFVSMGYVLAGLARTSESAMATAQLINFPMMMLSGSIFPAEMLPDLFKPVATVLPLTYLSDLLRQTMVGAPAMHPMMLDVVVLAAWLGLLSVLAVKLWRWE